jgi:signal transduction histidine kinase
VTRRIVASVLGLIVVLLGTIALPLGLLTAAQDRRDFTDATKSTAVTLANVAEERLGDHASGKPARRLVADLSRTGDRVWILDRSGARIAATSEPPQVTAAQLSRGQTATQAAVYQLDDYVLAVAPIRSDNGAASLGVVALARPTASVDHRVVLLWTVIGAVSAAGLLAAALVAIGLARWVSRPLGTLEHAAQQLGDGNLSTRSPVETGPREVRQLAANFNLMAARLEALVHGHQATMADVSHQLRTPLAALRLRLELLAQDSTEPLAAELAGAQEEIARLSRLVNGLLAVARAEQTTAAPVLIAVDAVVTSRVAAWRPAAEEQEVTVTASVDDPVQVRLGDGQLEQILDNLLANSLDALGPGGSIVLSAGRAGGRARITVADDGPGMTAGQKRTAFRRFATGSAGGTGLGLAIVDRLVVSGGGTATLSDTDGGGLTVTILLPAAIPDRGQRRGPAGPRPGAARPGPSGRGGR